MISSNAKFGTTLRILTSKVARKKKEAKRKK